jgi:hypothetical protein
MILYIYVSKEDFLFFTLDYPQGVFGKQKISSSRIIEEP